VIPARACRLGREFHTKVAVRRHKRAAFFLGTVSLDRNEHAVPVDELRRVGVVEDVDGDRLALFHTQQRPGNLAVIADGLDGLAWRDLVGDRPDADGVIHF
jgi:hypothetical protein